MPARAAANLLIVRDTCGRSAVLAPEGNRRSPRHKHPHPCMAIATGSPKRVAAVEPPGRCRVRLDSSPSLLDEVEAVLLRHRFSATRESVRLWTDAFVRASHQVFPEAVPSEDARAVGGDAGDLPILRTAFAALADGSLADALGLARDGDGLFIVSEDVHDFVPGHNVYGWEFITSVTFVRKLLRRGSVR